MDAIFIPTIVLQIVLFTIVLIDIHHDMLNPATRLIGIHYDMLNPATRSPPTPSGVPGVDPGYSGVDDYVRYSLGI